MRLPSGRNFQLAGLADKADRNADNNTKISDGNRRNGPVRAPVIPHGISGRRKRLEPPAYLTDKPADKTPPEKKRTTIYGGECKMASSNRSNRVEVPEAKAAMDRFKTEVASELGVNLKEGYNGDLTSRGSRLHRRRDGTQNDQEAGGADEITALPRSDRGRSFPDPIPRCSKKGPAV